MKSSTSCQMIGLLLTYNGCATESLFFTSFRRRTALLIQMCNDTRELNSPRLRKCAKLFLSELHRISTNFDNLHRCGLGEVENECIQRDFILFAISMPKVTKVGGNLTKFWQKQSCTFSEMWHSVHWKCAGNMLATERLVINRLTLEVCWQQRGL